MRLKVAHLVGIAALILALTTSVVPVLSVEKGPVGADMLQRLDLLPYLFCGNRMYHTSSHHPSGQNDDHDLWLYTSGTDKIIFDDKGPGCITRMWFTNRYGTEKALLFGTIKIYVDDSLLYSGTLTTYPSDGKGTNNVVTGGLLSGWMSSAFNYPIVGNRDDSSGGFYCYTPISYRQSCKIIVNYTKGTLHQGYYYNIDYKKFDSNEGIRSFSMSDDLSSVDSLWTNTIAGKENFDPKQPFSVTRHSNPGSPVTIASHQEAELVNLNGPGCITAVRLKLNNGANNDPTCLTDLAVKISYDGRPADVRCILGHFFGTDWYWPTKWDPVNRVYVPADVNGLLFGVNGASRWMYNYFPMPFGSNAKIIIENNSGNPVTVEYAIDSAPMPDAARLLQTEQIGYFCSTQNLGSVNSVRDTDYNVANIQGRGKIVGMVYSPKSYSDYQNYLEGDERIYIDGSRTPSVHGTGTEDTFNGGWYMKWGHFTQPTHGYTTRVVGAATSSNPSIITEYDRVSLYRIFVGDSISFNSELKFDFECGDYNNVPLYTWNGTDWVVNCGTNRYGCLDSCSLRSTVFYYLAAVPVSALAGPDIVDVGNIASEAAHGYTHSIPGSLPVSYDYAFETHYKAGHMIENGREFSGRSSQFTVSITPNNYGVKLRRMLNYFYANQQALVKVDGEPVGTWYDAGLNSTKGFDNTYVRAWRDSDFEIPARYTQGKASITVTVEPIGGGIWTEFKYFAYSYVSPMTAPPSPLITDSGDYTTDKTSLSFTITPPNEPVWGINGYSFAIGTAPLAEDVSGWTEIGTNTSYTAGNLQLEPGKRYFISIKARNGLGIWSAPASSDGISVPVEASDITSAKDLANDAYVTLNDVVVTANFGDFFYIEQTDRSSGIKVSGVQTAARNDMVDVTGLIKTDISGEKYIEAGNVSPAEPAGTFDIKPIGIAGKALGGSSTASYDPATGKGQVGVVAFSGQATHVLISGANNIGLLIKAFGKVVWTDNSCFYLDDGSKTWDFEKPDASQGRPAGVKVYVYNTASVPSQGSFAAVTGISSIFKADDGTYRRCIRVPLNSDIRTLE